MSSHQVAPIVHCALSFTETIVIEFDISRKQDDFVFCGRRVRVTPEALLIRQEFAASSLVPMELYGPQRSAETMLTRSLEPITECASVDKDTTLVKD